MRLFFAAALSLAATGVHAQVGEIGLSFGANTAREGQVGNPTFIDEDTVGFATLQGSYSFALNNGLLLQFDAGARYDDFQGSTDFTADRDPELRAWYAAHALWGIGADMRLGGFVAYGDTLSQGGPAANHYDVAMIGAEAQNFFSDDLLGYAQLAVADKVRDGQEDDEGFNSGIALRLGATYFLNDRTAFNLDTEFAGARVYTDGNDPGRFFAVSLGGETRLKTQAPLFATYGVAYNSINAADEESVDEVQVAIGLKLLFGANSSREAARAGRSIGTPQLPLRASAWAETLDNGF